MNAGFLYRYLRRDGVYSPGAAWRRLIPQVVVACAVMGVVLWFGAAQLDIWIARGALARVQWLMTWLAVGVVVYFAVLAALGVRPRQFLSHETVK